MNRFRLHATPHPALAFTYALINQFTAASIAQALEGAAVRQIGDSSFGGYDVELQLDSPSRRSRRLQFKPQRLYPPGVRRLARLAFKSVSGCFARARGIWANQPKQSELALGGLQPSRHLQHCLVTAAAAPTHGHAVVPTNGSDSRPRM
jgi:hypothetical protein